MRTLSAAVLALFAITTATAQSSESAAAAEAMAMFPTCALTCLEEIIPTSNCTATDVNCICTNAPLQAEISECVTLGCNTYQALATKNASATMCEVPVRDKRAEQQLVAIVGCSITLVVYLLRIAAKLKTLARKLSPEDYIITAAMALTIVTSVFHSLTASHGVGKDIWTLTPQEIEDSLKSFLITELAYFVAIGLIKLSVLSLVLRIIPDKKFRLQVFAVMGLVAAYTLAFFVGTLFQCRPVAYTWKQLDAGFAGHCNHINLQVQCSVAINIVIDVVVIVLPLPHLWRLQLSFIKKVTVMAMFLIGLFVTAISCVRLQAFIAFASSINLTWDNRAGANWSLIELFAGVVCACIPSLRPLLVMLKVKIAKSTGYDNTHNATSKPWSNPTLGNENTNNNSAFRKGRTKRMETPVCGDNDGEFVRLVEIENGSFRADKRIPENKILQTTTVKVEDSWYASRDNTPVGF